MKFHEKTDFYKGYQLTLQNAKDHLSVALIAKDISIGIANSHLILAAEEAVKANMIFLYHHDKTSAMSQIKDMDKYFNSHKHKHEMIRSMEIFTLFLENMMDAMMAPILKSKGKNLTKEEKRGVRNEVVEAVKTCFENIAAGKLKLNTNEDWWLQADDNKNIGFYISHVKKTGTWKGPFDISLLQFNKSKKIVMRFVENAETMCEFSLTDQGKELYKDFMLDVDKSEKDDEN